MYSYIILNKDLYQPSEIYSSRILVIAGNCC